MTFFGLSNAIVESRNGELPKDPLGCIHRFQHCAHLISPQPSPFPATSANLKMAVHLYIY
jgi:hypothetical protein